MHKIRYNTKTTQATTTYVDILPEDKNSLLQTLMSINNYMQELSVSKDPDIKAFCKWYTQPNQQFLYNTKLRNKNSPQSFIAGSLNNLVWGSQHDFSLVQLELVQTINNTCVDIIEEIIKEKNIDLQKQPAFTKVWVEENLWIS